MKKINFGCFNRPINGWINIEFALKYIISSKFLSLFRLALKLGIISKYNYFTIEKFKGVSYGDIRKRLKYKSNSIDVINHTHVLEHLYYDEAIKFLNECYRILKPKGIMRVCVPNFKLIVDEYIKSIKSKNSEIGTEKTMDSLYARNKYSQTYGHKWMYDKDYLIKILKECGFNYVKMLNRNIFNGEILDEHTAKDSIIIEAIK